MPPGKQPQVELLTEGYLGCNNVMQFSQLPRESSPKMQNAWQPKINAIGKRAGSRPVTTTALPSTIKYLTTYKESASAADRPKIFAASGTALYEFNGTDTLVPQTMTNPLNQADIYTVGFTNGALTSRLLIGDGGSLKGFNGTAVANITPAPDKPSPAPANALNGINAKGVKFVSEFTGHVFVSPGTNELFYSDRWQYDYFQEVQYFFLTKDNDFINGPCIPFDNVCLIPMRRSWAILTGSTFDNFDASEYLNTNDGVIAPRSIQKVTYPDGMQSIIYLSDSGLMEVFTAIHDRDSKLYATRDLMKEVIDFEGLNLTEAEKEEAVGFYDASRSIYLLSFKQNGVDITYAYDLRNRQWYPNWTHFNAKSYVSLDSVTYFAGDLRHLCMFDKGLYSDWNDAAMTSGTPVHFKRYTPLLSLEFSGYASYWDYYLIEAKQFLVPASLDITVIFGNSASNVMNDSPWKLNVAVYGVSRYGEARYANLFYTDIVNAPKRKVFKKKAKYVQVLWENNRDEPIEIFKDLWIGRSSGQ